MLSMNTAKDFAVSEAVSPATISNLRNAVRKNIAKINQWDKVTHNWWALMEHHTRLNSLKFTPTVTKEFFLRKFALPEDEFGMSEVMKMFGKGYDAQQISYHLKLEKKVVYRMKYQFEKHKAKIFKLTNIGA